MARQRKPLQGSVLQGHHQGRFGLGRRRLAQLGQVAGAVRKAQAKVAVGVAIEALEGAVDAIGQAYFFEKSVFQGPKKRARL